MPAHSHISPRVTPVSRSACPNNLRQRVYLVPFLSFPAPSLLAFIHPFPSSTSFHTTSTHSFILAKAKAKATHSLAPQSAER